MARAVCAATYTKLGEKMQFLWGSDMRLNTVQLGDIIASPPLFSCFLAWSLLAGVPLSHYRYMSGMLWLLFGTCCNALILPAPCLTLLIRAHRVSCSWLPLMRRSWTEWMLLCWEQIRAKSAAF
jgi:hypothetical protein